ncbi:bifunctional metallophosphatase/5'-nucleotidase [Streptomyces sp. 4N509B]|uniref:bifunctional metallophosphatase/5'-nucleotidase n=1 Tax=Streptomyces sp. 4N509B TaxID=3457413 RepID=UPI003FD59318
MTAQRAFSQIVATTGVHSAFESAVGMLARLHAIRATSLVVDCGGFFSGTGYYRLGAGSLERQALSGLYDVLAPSAPGWPHYFEAVLHERTVCANAVDAGSGQPLFHRLHWATVGGKRVAVTAVVDHGAFTAIPAHRRLRQEIIDPAEALQQLWRHHHTEADAWVLLSRFGVDEAVKLADACPFLNVIFTRQGSDAAPLQAGDALLLAGGERGTGYAVAEPASDGWAPRIGAFPAEATLPLSPDLAPLGREITQTRARLAAPLGSIADRWRETTPDRRELAAALARRLHTGGEAEAVILNDSALRAVPLGRVLTLGDALTAEPFGHHLVQVALPEPYRGDADGLLARLAHEVGPLSTAPDPLPEAVSSVLTTDYLAETYLGDVGQRAGISLGQALRHALSTAGADSDNAPDADHDGDDETRQRGM